ncbi:MAG: ABC transporter permease subunit [Isosphaeraceae bacterium]
MKTLVIARATFKEAIRQPAFYVLIFLSAFYLFWSIYVSYFTFGEDIKMYKDTGLTTIAFVSLLLALLTSSSTVADEIEGKTAITLLSKPINRRQFLIGKYLGIEAAVLAMILILGAIFCGGVWYKYAYDLRENAGGDPVFATRVSQVLQVLPGLALVFFEVSLLTSISVAISTRLPILVNLVLSIALFFLGHLTPVLVKSTEAGAVNDLVPFMARLFEFVLPSLAFFNAGPAIATGAIIPWTEYIIPAFIYCLMYSSVALCFAFILFEDRDLA